MLRLLFFWDMTLCHIPEEQKPEDTLQQKPYTEIVHIAGHF